MVTLGEVTRAWKLKGVMNDPVGAHDSKADQRLQEQRMAALAETFLSEIAEWWELCAAFRATRKRDAT